MSPSSIGSSASGNVASGLNNGLSTFTSLISMPSSGNSIGVGTATVSSSTQTMATGGMPTSSVLPTLPPGYWYYQAPNGDIFIIAQTPPEMELHKRQLSPFESCVDACSSVPSCSEAIYFNSNGTCTFASFTCTNPTAPPDADIAILAGNSTGGVTVPPCLGSLNVMILSSSSLMSLTSTVCLARRLTTTVYETVTDTNCPSTCPVSSPSMPSFL
jgi:hypothetical protein